MTTKKTTLKHMQENGEIATRQTARAYTHVLLRKQDNATRVQALKASRETRLARAIKYARRRFAENTLEIQAGIGGQILYWPGQGGFDGRGATHAQPDYQYNMAVEAMEKHKDLTGYINAAIAECDAELAREIEHVNKRSEEWLVVSWHSRADLAKPQYAVDGDLYKVEAINGGTRGAA